MTFFFMSEKFLLIYLTKPWMLCLQAVTQMRTKWRKEDTKEDLFEWYIEEGDRERNKECKRMRENSKISLGSR